MPPSFAFRKGHGTGNDFVVLPDPGDLLRLTPRLVRSLCDRRFGVGGDGVIRVVPAQDPAGPAWFMDYWNADGSMAEMCGNGARLFARHLVDVGAEPAGAFLIGTRGGVRRVDVPANGPVSVGMGQATGGDLGVEIRLDGRLWQGHSAFVPNPHAVAFVADLDGLGSLEGASVAPASAFPAGVNIEWVQVEHPGRLRMRVLERGSGETLSCGTGACAVAWVHRRSCADVGAEVTVAVPGGEVTVTEESDGQLTLTGPARFVAAGTIDPEWWRDHI